MSQNECELSKIRRTVDGLTKVVQNLAEKSGEQKRTFWCYFKENTAKALLSIILWLCLGLGVFFGIKQLAWNPISDGISSVAAVPEKVWNKSTHSLGNGWCKMSLSCEMHDGVRVYNPEEEVVEVEDVVDDNFEVSTTPGHELVTEDEELEVVEEISTVKTIWRSRPTWLGGKAE